MRSNRKIVVLTSLVAMLTLASAILLLLAPPPLAAEGFNSLSATDHGPFLDGIFKTAVAAKGDQWKFIYIHHSATAGGNAGTLAIARLRVVRSLRHRQRQRAARWRDSDRPALERPATPRRPAGRRFHPARLHQHLRGRRFRSFHAHPHPGPASVPTGDHAPNPIPPRGRQGHPPERHRHPLQHRPIFPGHSLSRPNPARKRRRLRRLNSPFALSFR